MRRARLITKRINDHRYYDDIRRIQSVLKDHFDTRFEMVDCIIIWESYSDVHCAGWMRLPDDDVELAHILNTTLDNLEYEIIYE